MPNGSEPLRQFPEPPIVLCPGCRKPMKPVALQSLETPFEVTTYKCPTCEALTQRITQSLATPCIRFR